MFRGTWSIVRLEERNKTEQQWSAKELTKIFRHNSLTLELRMKAPCWHQRQMPVVASTRQLTGIITEKRTGAGGVEGLEFESQASHKKPGMAPCVCNPGISEQRWADPEGSLTSKPTGNGKGQIPWETVLKVARQEAITEAIHRLAPAAVYEWTGVSTWMYHIPTHTHTQFQTKAQLRKICHHWRTMFLHWRTGDGSFCKGTRKYTALTSLLVWLY